MRIDCRKKYIGNGEKARFKEMMAENFLELKKSNITIHKIDICILKKCGRGWKNAENSSILAKSKVHFESFHVCILENLDSEQLFFASDILHCYEKWHKACLRVQIPWCKQT